MLTGLCERPFDRLDSTYQKKLRACIEAPPVEPRPQPRRVNRERAEGAACGL